MRIKTTINDTNGTDISKKIYHSRLSNTQQQNCLTHSGTNLHSSVSPSQIGSKPNNILFLILIDCLLFLSEKVTENISKCYSLLTRELRACARASYRYDLGNGIRSLARSLARLVDSCKLFFRF